eukprot:1420674-Pleurochrysis_carterae.AAC.1
MPPPLMLRPRPPRADRRSAPRRHLRLPALPPRPGLPLLAGRLLHRPTCPPRAPLPLLPHPTHRNSRRHRHTSNELSALISFDRASLLPSSSHAHAPTSLCGDEVPVAHSPSTTCPPTRALANKPWPKTA